MQCPACEIALDRTKYSSANVRQCKSCHGMLLDKTRASRIEKRVNKDVQTLVKEVEASEAPDLKGKIRCPACRNRMKKVLLEEFDFNVDECSNCDKAWFDGGELAKIQLAFESEEQTVELNRMRERLRSMSDEERAEYEERIANLKDLGTPMEQAVSGAAVELTVFYYWRSFRTL